MCCVIVHDKYYVDCVHALNFCVFLCFFSIIMSAIDCDNGWPAFDGCMPFWQPSRIINFCLVIVFILLWKINFLSIYSLQANSQAQSGVAITEKILKQGDSVNALTIYMSTAVPSTECSQSKLLMWHELITTVSILSKNMKPSWPDMKMMVSDHVKSTELQAQL